jgi:predicted permease
MMETPAGVWQRIKAIILRRRLERDLDDELAFHLAMREAEQIGAGRTAERARTEARRLFGNVTHYREQTRDAWTFPAFESLRQDVRFALRTLRKSPGFTVVVVLALAIGIGGNMAIFSLLDAARSRALPYKDPDALVQLAGNVMRATLERRGTSYPDFVDWRERSRSFEDMAAFDTRTTTVSGTEAAERVLVEFVSSPYFSLLGIQSARGRTFTADEDRVATPAFVTILSEAFWRRRFGADPGIVGSAVLLDGRPFTIIGVMPPGFKGLSDAAELWAPFALFRPPAALVNRVNRGSDALARLKPGVTIASAQAEMDAISRRLEQAYPDTNAGRGVAVIPLETALFGAMRPALQMLMAAIAFVLLIACANVANLLLARSEARRREIAVRTALGAGRRRLFRQLVTESCVLTALGAGAGLLVAIITVNVLVTSSPVTFPSFLTPELDARVAAFTVVVSLVCGILVGLVPGWQAHSIDLNNALKDTARGSEGPRAHRLRSGLVVAELSLAVVLLVGAGLMIRSVRNLISLDPGFNPESVLTLRVSVPRVDNAPVVRGGTLLERIRAVPGVVAAAIGTELPLDGNASAGQYSAEGMAATSADSTPRIYNHRVSPEFFETLRIALLAGRTFTAAELTPKSQVVIVSERVVKRFWPGQDPIGKRIKLGTLASPAPWLSIVGVVADIKYRGLPDNPTSDPDVYLPFVDGNAQFGLAIRASVPPSSLAAQLRALVRSSDASVPVYQVATMDELIGGQTAQSRFTTWLMTVFAGIALVLAAIGIYGVMSYHVTQRTREIGIRLTLGAAGSDILRLVVGNGARLIAIGIGIGITAAFALQRLIASLLFGVTAADAVSVIAVAVLAGVALLACYVPAARAARVDPLHALRHE